MPSRSARPGASRREARRFIIHSILPFSWDRDLWPWAQGGGRLPRRAALDERGAGFVLRYRGGRVGSRRPGGAAAQDESTTNLNVSYQKGAPADLMLRGCSAEDF